MCLDSGGLCVCIAFAQVLDPSVHHLYRDMTLGEYLTREGYSRYFVNNYVAPMCAAVWSVPNQQVRLMHSLHGPRPTHARMCIVCIDLCSAAVWSVPNQQVSVCAKLHLLFARMTG